MTMHLQQLLIGKPVSVLSTAHHKSHLVHSLYTFTEFYWCLTPSGSRS